MSIDLDYVPDENFPIYNREQELRRREREQKELIWEEELLRSMQLSEGPETVKTPNDTANDPVNQVNLRRSTSYSGHKNVLADVQEQDELAKTSLTTRTSRWILWFFNKSLKNHSQTSFIPKFKKQTKIVDTVFFI